jgi:hypothetical protein
MLPLQDIYYPNKQQIQILKSTMFWPFLEKRTDKIIDHWRVFITINCVVLI